MVDLIIYHENYEGSTLYNFKNIAIDKFLIDDAGFKLFYIHSFEDYLEHGIDHMEVAEQDTISRPDEGLVIDGVVYLMGTRSASEFYDWIRAPLDRALSKNKNSEKMFYYKQINPNIFYN